MLFISSTYVDLIAERQAARQELEAPGSNAIGGMEAFFSSPHEPLEVCLQWVAQAHALIVIVGFKAGSLIPASSTLTYTAAEVDAAAVRGIPVFAFIKTREGLWRNDEVDDTLRSALDAFKAKVVTLAKTPAYFSTPDELAIRVSHTIRDWENHGRPGGRQVFTSREEFFRLDSPATKYLQHRSPLHGRTEHMAALHNFLQSPVHICALLEARGGQGKTKLLHDWTSTVVTDWATLFVQPRAIWHTEVSREVPTSDRLLFVIDDAHRETDLFDRLLVLIRRIQGAAMREAKIIVAYRPSGQTALRAIAARRMGSEALCHLPPMKSLRQGDLRAIAEDILPDALHYYSNRLVAIAGDSPLVVSVSARMVAAGDVVADITDDERFKQEVLDRFYFDYAEQSEVAKYRSLLELLAAIGPVDIQGDWFCDIAAEFLTIARHEVMRGCAALESHGLVFRTRNGARVTPDVLGDHLFRGASVNPRGLSTGYIEALFEAFSHTPAFGNILTNASELGWTLRQGGHHFNPTATIWNGLRLAIKDALPYERGPILKAVKSAAFYEPADALGVVESMLDSASGDDEDVIEILSATAYHPDFTEQSVAHLWALAQREPRRDASHLGQAGKALRDLSAFGMNKHVEMNDRLVTIAISRATIVAAYQGGFSSLDIVDAILKKHAEHHESDDDTFYLSAHGLNYKVVMPVRRRALLVIRTALWLDAAEAQARAIRSMRSVLDGDPGAFGRVPPADELAWQDTERLEVIAMAEERAAAGGGIPLALLFCLGRMLRDFQGPADSPVLASARGVLKRFRKPRELTMLAALCSASWDVYRTAKGFDDRVSRASALFTKRYPDVSARVERFRALVESARRYGILQDTGASAVCEQLCADRPFVDTLIERIFGGSSTLTHFLATAVTTLRSCDYLESRRVLRRALQNPVTSLRVAAIHGAASGFVSSDMDIEGLAEAAGDDSLFVRRAVIHSLRWIARDEGHRAAAIETLTCVSPQTDSACAEELCGALAPYTAQLSREQVVRVLDSLVPIEKLDDYHMGELLQRLSDTHPTELGALMVRRLGEYRCRMDHASYGYRPVPTFLRHDLHQLAPHAFTVLAAFRNELPAASSDYKDELIGMFWIIGGGSNEALALVDEWLHAAELTLIQMAIALVARAPHGLSLDRPLFAAHVVALCAANGLSNEAKHAIVSNCRPAVWRRQRGSASADHLVVARARELTQEWSGTFVADAMSWIADQIEGDLRAIARADEF